MKSKKHGDENLKKLGLDGTWLPRGHFAEQSLLCDCGAVNVHHIDVRNNSVRTPQHDGIIKYSVDKSDGKVTMSCSKCGKEMMTYTPNIHYKDFDGKLFTVHDGSHLE